MPNTKSPRLLWICVAAGLMGGAFAGDLPAVDGDPPNICVALMEQHGTYLGKDRVDLADKVRARARATGCYDRPADRQLCDLLSQQEQDYNLAGRMDLVNIVRGQERSLRCISAVPRTSEGVKTLA